MYASISFSTCQSSMYETKSIFCRSIWQARPNRTAGRPKYKSAEPGLETNGSQLAID